ncbi:MAG: hypothetical protein IJP77_06335 [Bacteroidales bacterium]|nr:hypothetical protein [Bacteroidales bacterium]
MITEDYVSFETAKLLKEKGFDEPCQFLYFSKYKQEGDFVGNFNARKNSEINEASYSAPTLQMAMKWLREEKKLNCITDVSFNQNRNEETEYYFSVWENKPPYELLRESSQTFSTYEEACKTAIKYCLENLI